MGVIRKTSVKFLVRPTKKCEICSVIMEKPLNFGKGHWERKRFCSKSCQYKAWTGKNENAMAWKGEDVLVYTKHTWLYKNYGKANKCENALCKGKSMWFDWAKKTECEYEKKRENYWMLCRSCHRQYDMTEEKKQKAVMNLHWYRKAVI